MRNRTVDPGTDTKVDPSRFADYNLFLKAVRLDKGMTLSEVSRASYHPEYPGSAVKMPTLSRMEKGHVIEPSFRMMCRYARGYGVPLEKLEIFFRSRSRRANKATTRSKG